MSKRTARIEVELTGEKQYKQALKGISTEMKVLSGEQALLNAQIAAGGRTMETDIRQKEILSRRLDQQRQKLEWTKAALEKATREEGENSEHTRKLAADYAFAQASVTRAEKALHDFDEKMKKTTGFDYFRERVKQLEKDTPRFIVSLDKMGAALTKAVSLPLAAAATAAGKSFVDLEDQIYTVATIASRSVEQLTEDAIKASNRSGKAATEIAEGMYDAISSGVDEALAGEFSGLAAMAAKAGMTDVSTAVDGATSAINAWALGYENAESVFDKFIVAQNVGKTTLGDMAQSIGQLTGIAPQVGVSLDEVLAATAALTKNGVQTSSAMNGLKAVMQTVIKPTAEAGKAAKKLKLDFSSAALAEKGLTGFLSDVLEKTKGDSALLSKLFGSVEGLSQVMLLGGAAAEDYADALDQMANSAGVLQAAFDTKTQSKAERFSMSLNKVKNAGIALGQEMAPSLDILSGGLENAAEWVSTLTAEQVRATAGFGLLAASIGPVMTVFSKLYQTGQKTNAIFKAMGTSNGGVLLALTAVAALSAGVIKLHDHLDSLRGVNQLQAAFDNVALDTSAIDAAVEAAGQVEYELTLHAQSKLEFALEGDNLEDEISAYFGRKNPSYKTREQFKKDVAAWIAPLLSDGQEAVDEETKKLEDALQAAADEYTKYALKLAQSSKDPTAEQLAQLEALKQKVIEIGNEIMAATNKSVVAAEAAYVKAKRGEGTTQDYAMAAVWAQGQRNERYMIAEKTYEPLIEEANAALVAADAAGDAQAYAAAAEELAAAEAEMAAAKETADKSQAEMANELAEGLQKQFPEQAAAIEQLAQMQAQYEELLALTEADMDSADFDDDAWAAQVASAYEETMGRELSYGKQQGLAEAMEHVKEQMAALVSQAQEGGFGDILEPLYASIGSGLLTGVTDSELGDALRGMLMTIDLSDDGQTLGEQLVLGEAEGLENPAAEDTMTRHAESVVKTAMEAYDIHSPSKRFEEIGYQLPAGEAEGILRGGALVENAFALQAGRLESLMTASMYHVGVAAGDALIAGLLSRSAAYAAALAAMSAGQAGGNEGATPGGKTPEGVSATGVSSPNVTVHYTGSVSQRDSRKLGQLIAKTIK